MIIILRKLSSLSCTAKKFMPKYVFEHGNNYILDIGLKSGRFSEKKSTIRYKCTEWSLPG